jgi:asparagine synthase (glutamine-hydrolysing)
MGIDPADKMIKDGRMEKYILRKAFDTTGEEDNEPYLPENILWRQKEQFSDGVGYSWIDSLREMAAREVSDADLERAAERFPIHPPTTHEGYYYRRLFARHFPGAAEAACVPGGKSIACSSPQALAWDPAFAAAADPSGRSIHGIHRAG